MRPCPHCLVRGAAASPPAGALSHGRALLPTLSHVSAHGPRDRGLCAEAPVSVSLCSLEQEDFVKWKGSLFFRFVSTLVDPHPDIAR